MEELPQRLRDLKRLIAQNERGMSLQSSLKKKKGGKKW